MGIGRIIGETIDTKVRMYWKEGLFAAAPVIGTLVGEQYMPDITYFIYDKLDPDLPEDTAELVYKAIPWAFRFVETGLLGAPFVRQIKKRFIQEEWRGDLWQKLSTGTKRWFRAGVVAGTVGVALLASYPAVYPKAKQYASTKYTEIKSRLQEYVERFAPPELVLDEKDIGQLVRLLEGNPGGVVNFLQKKWHDRYTNPRDLKPNLEMAINRSRPEIAAIKHIFKSNGVPQELAFLAMTESHWRWNAESPRKARGLYQFIESTARKSGCKVDPTMDYDERLNQFLAADCAARHLSYLHSQFNKDWNLALAAYNSGMPWRYKQQANAKDEKIDYHGYLRFLASEIKKTKSNERLRFINENLNYPPHSNAIVRILRVRHTPYYRKVPREEVRIVRTRYPTLRDVAKHEDIVYKKLREYNRHVRDKQERLPSGSRVVIPRYSF